jgi:hypothetical protein
LDLPPPYDMAQARIFPRRLSAVARMLRLVDPAIV